MAECGADSLRILEAGKQMDVVPYSDVTYKIIGCAIRVHNQLGPGLREAIYQRALASEMELSGLVHEEERAIKIVLGDRTVGILYLDHMVEDSVVVEVKALRHKLTNDEIGQVITYLAATEKPVGLLINFAGRSLEYRRILRPRKVADWQARVQRYVRRTKTPTESDYPFKESAVQ